MVLVLVHYPFIDVTGVMAMRAMDIWTRSPCEFCNSVILVSTVYPCELSDRYSPGTAM